MINAIFNVNENVAQLPCAVLYSSGKKIKLIVIADSTNFPLHFQNYRSCSSSSFHIGSDKTTINQNETKGSWHVRIEMCFIKCNDQYINMI